MTPKVYISLLHEADLKVTPARIAVLEYLRNNRPADVASIIDHLTVQGIEADPATVFRIINIFTQKKITKQVRFAEDKFRYELNLSDDHHHLICENCGSVDDISDCGIAELEKEIHKKKKFVVKHHSLEFFGLCAACQQ